MTEGPLLSVAIPFLNADRTLSDAIRSVFAQTFQDWELILVDDGSRDNSLQIARSVADPRVRVISDGMKKGLPFRLNQIAGLARGQFLARMDADDLMHPDRLQSQLDFFAANPTVEVTSSAVYVIDEENLPVGFRCTQPLQLSARTVFPEARLIHPSVMARTSWFRANPYHEMDRGEDVELWIRTFQTTNFHNIRVPLMFYRERKSGHLQTALRSRRSRIAIYRHYGPALIGRLQTAELIGKTYLKAELYRLFCALGREHVLVSRRNTSISAQQRQQALQVIDQIRQTKVSGWSPC